MIGKYKIITLCGSTKFKDEFLKVQKQLTLEGNIVISVGFFEHADNEFENIITPEIKIMFDDMHKRKIDMSDEIYVINKNGYIGESTKNDRLLYWQENTDKLRLDWAEFLLDDTSPNKERLLSEKIKLK